MYIYIYLYMRLIYLVQWASNVFTQLKVTEIHDSMVNWKDSASNYVFTIATIPMQLSQPGLCLETVKGVESLRLFDQLLQFVQPLLQWGRVFWGDFQDVEVIDKQKFISRGCCSSIFFPSERVLLWSVGGFVLRSHLPLTIDSRQVGEVAHDTSIVTKLVWGEGNATRITK